MHRIIFNLFVAVLTFALGIVASVFLNGFISPHAEKVNSRAVLVQKAPAPEIISETISTRCGCSQGTDETVQTTEESESSAAFISGGILNGKALSLPNPSYPAIARAARASGNVTVEILIDERGCVRSARAVSGHPLLQAAAVEAARQACFPPTRLSGHPEKVKGILSYNFQIR
jgi:TonB family protein